MGFYGDLLNYLSFQYDDSSTSMFGDGSPAPYENTLELKDSECISSFSWYFLSESSSYLGCGAQFTTNQGASMSVFGGCLTGGSCWSVWSGQCSTAQKNTWTADNGKCITGLQFDGLHAITGIVQSKHCLVTFREKWRIHSEKKKHAFSITSPHSIDNLKKWINEFADGPLPVLSVCSLCRAGSYSSYSGEFKVSFPAFKIGFLLGWVGSYAVESVPSTGRSSQWF